MKRAFIRWTTFVRYSTPHATGQVFLLIVAPKRSRLQGDKRWRKEIQPITNNAWSRFVNWKRPALHQLSRKYAKLRKSLKLTGWVLTSAIPRNRPKNCQKQGWEELWLTSISVFWAIKRSKKGKWTRRRLWLCGKLFVRLHLNRRVSFMRESRKTNSQRSILW